MSVWEELRRADPVLGRLLDEHGEPTRSRTPRPEHYSALVRSIVGQQLSVTAARAIHARLLEYFGGREPVPDEVLAAEPDALRAAAGLSRAKVAFLRSLAEHVVDGSLELGRLDELSDDEVVGELTAVKGIGEWSAHMFLMFHLQRPDVLPVGDLGIRNAVKAQYRLRKLPDPKRLEKIARPWRPHRTLACLFLWSSLDNKPG